MGWHMQRPSAALVLILSLLFPGLAVSGPFEDAVEAHRRGDYQTAYRLSKPLAGSSYAAFHRHPQQPHETQSSVGKPLLVLPGALRSPVLVPSPQMRSAAFVPPQFDFLQLGNGNAQCPADFPEAGIARFLRGLGNLFEEVPAERVVRSPHRAVRTRDERILAYGKGKHVSVTAV